MQSIRRTLLAFPGRLLLIFWTVLTLAPFVLIFLLSFRTNADVFNYPLGFGGSFNPENYATAWNGDVLAAPMSSYFVNTGIAAGAAIVLSLGVGSLAAYFATKLAPRAKAAFLAIFLVAQVVPFILIVIPYFQVFNFFGLLSNPLATGAIYGVLALPTTVLVMHAFFSDFPVELAEAAACDGLSEMRVFIQIVMPLSKGSVFAVGMLNLIYVWGEAQLGVVLLQDPSSQTVSVGMLGFQGMYQTNFGALFAGLSIAAIPLIVIYLIFNRTITKGIALGGVSR